MGEAAAAQAAAIAQAINASGMLVRLDAETFSYILNRHEAPLVVRARGGLFGTRWVYLMPYKGLAFLRQRRPTSAPSRQGGDYRRQEDLGAQLATVTPAHRTASLG